MIGCRENKVVFIYVAGRPVLQTLMSKTAHTLMLEPSRRVLGQGKQEPDRFFGIGLLKTVMILIVKGRKW